MARRRKKEDPSSNEKQLHDWAVGLLEEGQSRRRPHEAQWWENIATFAGDLWVEFDSTLNNGVGELTETSAPDHRVRLPINLAQPAVRTEYSKLLKNRPIINCIARSPDRSDLNSADVGDDMLNEYGEKQFHKAKVRRRVLQWVLICGYGAYFVDYDNTLLGEIEAVIGPDGGPVFDPEAIKAAQEFWSGKHQAPKTITIPQGDQRHMALSPWQLIFDFSQMYVEDASWCIVSEVFDVDEVYRRWKVEVDPDDQAQPGVMEKRLLMKTTLNQRMTDQSGTTGQRLTTVHRLFVKPGHRYFSDGAEIIFTTNELLKSTKYPYKHGELPVSGMGHIFFPVSQHPMSIVQQLRPIVLEISKTESQLIENRNLMSNPPWIEFRQNRIKDEIQNKPGARIEIDYVPGVPEPHPIQMPDMPDYVKQLPEIFGNHVLEISGQNETSQGQVPPGARSGVAIAYLTEENDTKLGPTVQEYEEMMERAGWQELQNYAQFYDAPRTVRIYRKNSEPKVIDFMGTMLEGVGGVNCQAGSALPKSLAAKQQYYFDLWDRGLVKNPRTMMEALEIGQGEQDEWEVDMDQAERENRKLQLGQPVEVLDWYNHQAHLYVHHQFMKSADFEDAEAGVKDAFIAHEQEHQNELQSQQQNQLRQQMLAQGGGGGSNGASGTANGVTQPPPSGRFASPDDIGQVASGAQPPADQTPQ